MSNIFKFGKFILSSGKESDYKIDCDGLSDEDIEFFARLISQNINFKGVYGIPTGGNRLADALRKYCVLDQDEQYLIVDDVMTSGKSFEKAKEKLSKYPNIIGVCIFCRDKYAKPDWVRSIFEVGDFIL